MKLFSFVMLVLLALQPLFVIAQETLYCRHNPTKQRPLIARDVSESKKSPTLQSHFSFPGNLSGKVVPLIKSTINSGTDGDFNGVIKYVAKVGDILKPAITDMDGKIVEAGSSVLILDPKYWKDSVFFNTEGVQIAKDNFANAQTNLDRKKKLIKGHEISEKDYQNYLNTYSIIKNTFHQAQYSLAQSQQFLKGCFLTAPFECIVDEVLLPAGMAAGQPPTIVISQLNPIGIKIKMSRETANSITQETIVKIYSMRQNTPVGIIRGSKILKDDGIILQVYNTPEYGDQITIDGKTIPVIKHIGIVDQFIANNSNGLLGVPEKSIFSDNKGKYVWKGKGIKHMQSGNGIKSIFQIEKIYIKIANMKKTIAGNTNVIALQQNDRLQVFDVVLTETKPNLQDGSQIYFVQERYQFMPGDTVKVVIGR
jgi:hypothetical protein